MKTLCLVDQRPIVPPWAAAVLCCTLAACLALGTLTACWAVIVTRRSAAYPPGTVTPIRITDPIPEPEPEPEPALELPRLAAPIHEEPRT